MADDFGYITAEGSWVSDTKLASSVQTTRLDCWRDKGYCIDSTAQINGDFLRVDNTYCQIKSWTPDEITFEDNDTALCTAYSLHVDRKNKTVTSVRSTKSPKPKGCEGIQEEPIFLHLADGPVVGRK